jgi:hypothetical protein
MVMPSESNVCEHGDHPAPLGMRFSSEECRRCEITPFDESEECAGLCKTANNAISKSIAELRRLLALHNEAPTLLAHLEALTRTRTCDGDMYSNILNMRFRRLQRLHQDREVKSRLALVAYEVTCAMAARIVERCGKNGRVCGKRREEGPVLVYMASNAGNPVRPDGRPRYNLASSYYKGDEKDITSLGQLCADAQSALDAASMEAGKAENVYLAAWSALRTEFEQGALGGTF